MNYTHTQRKMPAPTLPADLSAAAGILSNGAVLLGRAVACDAPGPRPIRVVTHCHQDHLRGLSLSFRQCQAVVMTPATRDMLTVLSKDAYIGGASVVALEYGQSLSCQGEEVTFHPAGHILGSAQVRVTMEDGVMVTYTGDFRLPGAEIVPSDILIMEATYGNPKYLRRFLLSVHDEMISLLRDCLRSGPVYVFGYQGKLQEVLALLHRADLGVPVFLEERIFQVAQVGERYGMELGSYALLDEGRVGSGEGFLALLPMGSRRAPPETAVKVILSGWEFGRPVRRSGVREYTVAWSDHTDFAGLMEYVSGCRPRLVITDGSRVRHAALLAQEIQRQLGIPALAMP